ncbi:MAG: ATP-binding protein, partial [Bacteroidota bacterium]
MRNNSSITRKYIVGVILAIIVLVSNQLFIQYWLAQKRNDSKTINLAGKQRMLSQRINLEFYRIHSKSGSTDSLMSWFEEWSTTHQDLINGAAGLNPVRDPEALELMEQMAQNIERIRLQINANQSTSEAQLDQLTDNQSSFLHKMDRVVNILEMESSRRLRYIVIIEIILMLLSLIIITLEVVYIYMPISRNLSNSLDELKDKHKELEASHQTIQEKNEDLEQFVRNVAHDLKEPLRTVHIYSSMLSEQNKTQLDDKGKRSLNFIQASIKRMQSQVEALLAHSRIGQQYAPQELDTNQIIEEVIFDLQAAIQDSGTIIQLGELPPIFGSAPEIRMLFQNLVMNAIKFQNAGGQPIISITGKTLQEAWRFKVSDNGIGIESDLTQTIFGIFQRGHSSSKIKGHGIGLAHCKKIVELHGGTIWVDSTPGQGSDFYFTIKRPVKDLSEPIQT